MLNKTKKKINKWHINQLIRYIKNVTNKSRINIFFKGTWNIPQDEYYLVSLFNHCYCLTNCDPMKCSMSGFPVLHYLSEVAQTHVHWFSDAIQPPHPYVAPFSSLRRFKKLRRLKLYQAAFQPLCYETWNQLQEKMAKKYRNVEYKQYNTKQTMNHWRNKRES